jgi:hypothetical protein
MRYQIWETYVGNDGTVVESVVAEFMYNEDAETCRQVLTEKYIPANMTNRCFSVRKK